MLRPEEVGGCLQSSRQRGPRDDGCRTPSAPPAGGRTCLLCGAGSCSLWSFVLVFRMSNGNGPARSPNKIKHDPVHLVDAVSSVLLPACLPACFSSRLPGGLPRPSVCWVTRAQCSSAGLVSHVAVCPFHPSMPSVFSSSAAFLLTCVCVCVCVCVCSPSRECQGEAHEPCDCDVWKLWLQKVSEMRPQEREYTTAVWFSTNVVHRLSARIERSSERLKDGDSLRGR